MQFAQQAVTEIVVPNNVPFGPGHAVFGIGTQLPQELIDASISAAIVGYTATYDPARTTPQTKYYFIAIQDVIGAFSAFKIGQCIVMNATVTQRGNLYDSFTSVKFVDGDQNLWNRIGYDEPPGQWSAGDEYVQLTEYINASLKYHFIDVAHTAPNYGWQGIQYMNGWTTQPAPGFNGRSGLFYRQDAAGNINLNGVISQGAAVAAYGEQVGHLPNGWAWPQAGVSIVAQCNSGPGVFNFLLDPFGNLFCTRLGSQTPSGTYYYINETYSAVPY